MAVVVLAALMVVPAALGYERYVITGDSMDGTYDRGSILFSGQVPTEEVAVGDVITYEPPPGASSDGLVTHRVVSIKQRDGKRVYRTAGDANGSRDPWRFELTEPTQARASFHVPYLGYGLAALSVREVRMLVIGLPAMLIAITMGARLWRDAGGDPQGAEPAETTGAV